MTVISMGTFCWERNDMAGVFDANEDYQDFASMSDYRLALDAVIKSAKKSLDVYDADLVDGEFDDLARNELLRGFLVQDASSRLRIILRDGLYLQQRATRMQKLMRDYSHRIDVRLLAEARNMDAFIYNDAGVSLYRPQYDHVKSIFSRRDQQRHRLFMSRFAIMFNSAECAISATTLGL